MIYLNPLWVRDFRYAMVGRANKVVIMTTGTITAVVKKETGREEDTSIEIVDGEKMVLMF